MHTVDVGVVDFNGDGIPDIVAVSSDYTNGDRIPDDTRLTVFPGVGDGSFGPPLVFELVEKGGTPIFDPRASLSQTLIGRCVGYRSDRAGAQCQGDNLQVMPLDDLDVKMTAQLNWELSVPAPKSTEP